MTPINSLEIDISLNDLIEKYNVPGPRYTSYPTVPYWKENTFSKQNWKDSLLKSVKLQDNNELSLYIHLPYCESLCTFCGCHKRITKNHDVELPYVEALLAEWKLYCEVLPDKPIITEIHLGGGTPTFFSPENLGRLMKGLLAHAHLADDFEFGIEAHPNNTTLEHLSLLSQLGFKRISFGIQDYSPTVQKAINRIQSFEDVQQVHNWALQLGFSSISHDLVFGLPFQTLGDIKKTIARTCLLDPDRLSFYSYAHVPWIKGLGQRGFSEENIPSGKLKREFYEYGKSELEKNGYVEIGMDHFAKKSDSLYDSFMNGSLHRNFMGYTTNSTKNLIGLGMSAISDSWLGFAQNEKTVEKYIESVKQGEFPVFRGHILSKQDLIIRQHILDLMCQFTTSLSHPDFDYQPILDRLDPLVQDNLLEIKNDQLEVSTLGQIFIRNICMCFDLELHRKETTKDVFSKTI